MAIKAVFSDIDQTLFSHSTKSVPLSAVHAVEDLQKKKHPFLLMLRKKRISDPQERCLRLCETGWHRHHERSSGYRG